MLALLNCALDLAHSFPERDQIPPSAWFRRVPFKDVDISVICAHFVPGVLRSVPLIQNFVHDIFVIIDTEPDGSLFRLITRVALNAQFHNSGL
jgi:hypothetical protein